MGVWTGAGERDTDTLALMPLLLLVEDKVFPALFKLLACSLFGKRSGARES